MRALGAVKYYQLLSTEELASRQKIRICELRARGKLNQGRETFGLDQGFSVPFWGGPGMLSQVVVVVVL